MRTIRFSVSIIVISASATFTQTKMDWVNKVGDKQVKLGRCRRQLNMPDNKENTR